MLKYLEGNRGQLESALFTQMHLIHVLDQMPNQDEAFPVYASHLGKKQKLQVCLTERQDDGCKDIDTKLSVVTDCTQDILLCMDLKHFRCG